MKDSLTAYKLIVAKRELARCFANAEASNVIFTQEYWTQEYWLNKAIEQEKIIKQLKGNGHE